MDPEQTVLSPIFDDGHRMIFEFRRAQIVSVNRQGDLETRLVAVHPVLGIVGTSTVHRFNLRLAALGARCQEYLAGAVDLFPLSERPTRMSRISIPEGEANLTFDSRVRPLAPGDNGKRDSIWPESRGGIKHLTLDAVEAGRLPTIPSE